MLAFHMRKVKRPSHPMRAVAVRMMMRGEATPREVAEAAGVSRQLVYYWCRSAGLVGKTDEARRAYVRNRLVAGARGEVGGSGKARLRKVADKAKRDWDLRRHAENTPPVGD